jgi:NitT/TauT family transport system substrate-binding protein
VTVRLPLWIAGCWLGLALLACGPAAAPPSPQAAPSAPPAAPAAAAAPPQHLDVAYVAPSETMAIPWIARESGIFAKHGLDVDLHLVSGTPRLVQALVAGDFDYAQVGGAAVITAHLENADTIMLASSGDYFNFKLMATAASGVHSIADLRGKTVGVSQIGSTSHTFLRVLLAREGIPLDEVRILQAGGNPQAATGMLSGATDAATVSGVMVPAAERAGAVTLADGKALDILATGAVLATTRRHVDRDREGALRFMRAYVEAIHYFRTHRDESIRIMQQYMSGLAYDEVAYLYDQVRDDYLPIPLPNEAAIQTTLDRDVMVPVGDLKPSDFYDRSILQEIEQSGFLATLN